MSAAIAGRVYLVGAGPGDPDLITVRGRECLERADVVIHDALANYVLLDYAPRAEKIFVGKTADSHTLLQDEINRLLLDWAGRVSCVVRLKGGDPFVFGRGGEEALFLAEHGVAFEVVPGVTAGLGAAAYAGVPVTHRGMAAGVALITGHAAEEGEGLQLELEHLALQSTLVFYMGVRNLPRIVDDLLGLGRAPDTPVALIEWGTYPRQRTVTGVLSTICARCADEDVQAPAVIVVGAVAALHDPLNWFERRPLSGIRVAVTRAQTQAADMVRHLRALGAEILEFPTIEIVPVEPADDMDYVGNYDWVVLTSVNAVDMLFDRLESLGQDARDLAGVRLCVIGSATADAVRKRFLRIDLMPKRYVAEDLFAALSRREDSLQGRRFLLPRADIARSFLPQALRDQGAEVTELVTYRTVVPETSGAAADAVAAFAPHVVTFTSSSTARNFCELLGPDRLDRVKAGATFATIGPITARTARELGFEPVIEAARHDVPGLIQAILEWAARRAATGNSPTGE